MHQPIREGIARILNEFVMTFLLRIRTMEQTQLVARNAIRTEGTRVERGWVEYYVAGLLSVE